MIHMTLREAQANFFTRLERQMDAATKKAYSRAGSIIRRRARRLTNKAAKLQTRQFTTRAGQTRQISFLVGAPPGEPPRKRTGAIRDLIVFAADTARNTVVVGPTLFSRPTGAPNVMEFGGTVPLPVRNSAGWPRRDSAGNIRFAPKRIAARPYMKRALDDVKSSIPEQWRGTLGGG